MLKAPAQGSETRTRIVDAAIETLRQDGFGRTSARSIARRGGFNQALIFYHFGTVNDLLLTAIDHLGGDRRRAYEEAFDGLRDLVEVVGEARRLYGEDVESGHATVVAELFAASSGDPALGEQMLARMAPWLDFTEALIRRFTQRTPLAQLVDARAAAGAAIALYIGMDMLVHLESDRSRATAMFDACERLASTLAPILGGDSR
jgi:AcrR family transcriptional regulator